MTRNSWLVRPIVLAVSGCFSVAPSFANPTGPQVISGTAAMQGLGSRNLNITNSPGAIIHWQGFSIGANEVTRFTQQSPASAVLNRVVGADISQIQGQLLSNGRVFLINPAGIIVGAGATIDTAGFVGSTLNMLNADFLAGKLRFQGDANSGSIVNQGWIKAGRGGNIILVAPNIQNSGVLQTEGGQLVLAAGQKLTIGSLDLEGVQFEIQAPADSVVNVGRLLADGGAVGVFAGTLKHSGDIRANALTRDAAGRIVLKARDELDIAAGSTITASGNSGGDILIRSVTGQASVAGEVRATGSAGQGGDIRVLGERVSLAERALIDASGAQGGGQIRVGGDFQGGNAAIQNAAHVAVGPEAMLRADATAAGDGGRVIVWADQRTQFRGSLSARGGAAGGNGGFAEVSGKQQLLFSGQADLSAPRGRHGDLLLDPLDLFIANLGGSITSIIDELTDVPGNAVTITPAALAAIAGNVTLQAGRYMRFNDPVTLTTPNQSLTATVDAWTPTQPAGALQLLNRIDIGANITTAGGAVSLTAPRIQTFAPSTIATSGGAITLNTSGATIQAGQLALNAGTGAVLAQSSSSIQLGAITGGNLTASIPGALTTGTITTTGPVSLTSSASSISTGSISSGGGNVTANASSFVNTGNLTTANGGVFLTSTNSSVNTGNTSAGNANVALVGRSGVFSGTIDTTGDVTLTATAGSINATVNNAASLNASASNTLNSASVTINQTAPGTPLNANSVTATASNCLIPFNNCPSATVTLNATGSVNVGTVSASAPVTGGNNTNQSVTIHSAQGGISAMSGSSQITAVDVTLGTGLGTGGGIGTTALPLNVNVARRLTLRPNGAFQVNLNGPGPNQLDVEVGVAPATQNYVGTLNRPAGGILLNASATDSTVTIDNPTLAGFSQRVYNASPSIRLRVPNGALTIPTITVPEGDTSVVGTAPLPVTLSASGNLVLNAYTRQSTPQSLAKTTTIESDNGTVALGAVNANKDTVTVTGGGNISISGASLTSAGNVTVTSNGGNITVGRIDTTSGTGSVTLNAASGQVSALADNTDVEVRSGSSIEVTGQTIGNPNFANNPLDLASAANSFITLKSWNTNGQIGFGTAAAPGAAVFADTPSLTIEATNPNSFNGAAGATFNVRTGAAALKNLTVTANPAAVNSAGGLARVMTEEGQPNARTYSFLAAPASFTFAPGTVPATQFAGGLLSFRSNAGDIFLGDANLGTGALSVNASVGSITGTTGGGPPALDGAGITLLAGTGALTVFAPPAVQIVTGNIGASVRPDTVIMTAGRTSGSQSRSGSVETGGVFNANNVTITTFDGGIRVGPTGNDSITSLAAPATGAITLTASNHALTAGSGAISVGGIFADSISLTSSNNAITTGNLNAANSISVHSATRITTAALDAPSVALRRDAFNSSAGAVVTGAIGGARPVTTLNIRATSIDTGAVTLNTGVADTVNIHGSGQVTIGGGGALVGGEGSTINVTSGGANPFQFTTIDAGATGSVTINSGAGIEQTADAASNGIFARDVTLTTGPGSITNSADALLRQLDLYGTSSLTVTTGASAAFDAHGSTLDTLDITKSERVATAPFTLANLGSGQTVLMPNLGPGTGLTINSPNAPLNFTFNYNDPTEAVTLAGAGIVTGGGSVNMTTSGLLDASAGGITTGGPGGGGSVNLFSRGGSITTGAINTAPTGAGAGVTPGGPITVTTNCAACDIVVSGNLQTGSNLPTGTAGSISLNVNSSGSVRQTGGSTITSASPATVSVTTADGDIGSVAAPLLITTPRATLNAQGISSTAGRVFATLTDTVDLTLTGSNGFNVASANTAFDILTLTTRGSGMGTPGTNTLNLASVGQTYAFERPAADLFGNPIANTFEVITAAGAGAGAAPSTAIFRASEGDLLVRGAASLTSPNLTLQTTSGTGDLKLQGNAAAALSLTNPQQTFSAGRDLLITGNLALTGSAAQTLTANRHITGQAQDGSLLVSYSGAGTQLVRAEGNIGFTAGSGPNQTARIVNTGTGIQQVGESRRFQVQTDNVTLQGGIGDGAFAEITSTGQQRIFVAGGTLGIYAGTGAGAYAQIENTGTNAQAIGASGFGDTLIGTLDLRGASNTASRAQIVAAGSQTLTVNTSTLLTAGTGANADALIRSTGPGQQSIRPGNLRLTAGTSAATTAKAQIEAAGSQLFTVLNAVTLTGGAGVDSFARINTLGTQTFNSFQSLTMTGGTNTGAFAKIDTGGQQSLTGSNGNIMLTAGGTAAAPLGNAGASIEGHSQNLSCGFNCNVTLTGGAGLLGNTSDALLRNLSGNQNVSAHSITLNGGVTHSSTGILNPASGGTQTITTTNAGAGNLTLASHAAALADAPVLIQNLAPTQQTITSARGVALNGRAAGPVSVTSAGTQNVQGQWIDVATSAGSTGNSIISATGNQFLRTTNGATAPAGGASVRAAALGTGTAGIDTAATQLLEIEYFEHMTSGANPPGSVLIGDAAAAGTSRVQAVNQSVFARTITVQGGLGAGSTAKLTGTNTQTLSTLDGSINVLGGGGMNATAGIDPVTQTIVANGNVALAGGNAAGATASILSSGTQTVFVTKGNTTLLGGAAAGATASIAGHSQSFTTCGTACMVMLTGGAGTAGNPSDALLRNLSGAQTINVGSLALVGGLQFSTAGVVNNPGAGAQSVTANGGGISLNAHANAEASASVRIQNAPATLQTITATDAYTTLESRGAGTVAITSAGTQSIDTLGLDVVTHASTPGGADATVAAAGDQTIRARGALALAQPTGAVPVGVRVASLSTGTAKIESGANQVLNVGLSAVGPPDTFVEGRLLIGSLTSDPQGAAAPGNIAQGNSLVQATNAAAPGGANQTVRAGSIQIQGPSGNSMISKLSADATQTVTTMLGGISVIGGTGTNSFAVIDPTFQTITSFGNVLLQGGTGPNADAIINATGPQNVTSLTGQVQLFGGVGPGADALIVTTSTTQNVTSAQGGNLLTQGPAGGGMAGFQLGRNDTGAATLASTGVVNEIRREHDDQNEARTDTSPREEEDPDARFRAQTCS